MATEIMDAHTMVTQRERHEEMEIHVDRVYTEKPKLHPLLIDHVIQNIVRQLINENEDGSVLNSRLVCHLWDEIATRSLQSHSNKTMHFGKYFRSPEILLNFIHYLHSSTTLESFPIGQFYLCEDIFKSCHTHIVQKFLFNCGSLITSLTIRLDSQSDMKVSDLDYDKLTLVNLKSVIFDDRRLVTRVNNSSLETSQTGPSTLLEVLVKCSPNLQKLTVIHPPSSMYDDDETIITQNTEAEINVAEMLVNNCPKYLSCLSLDIKFNDKVFSTLTSLPVNLAELKLSLRESTFSKESLNKLMLSQKGSLRELRLCSMGTKSHFELTFPSLPHLELLELHSWDSQIQGVTFSNFSYLKHFPSLKSLVLHTWSEHSSWVQFFPAAYFGTVPPMSSLKLPQNFMYPAMIQNLSWLYPNLKSLDLHYSPTTAIIIQRVFHYFRDNLEELRIRDSLPREKFDVCLDPLFTGLPQSVCEKILKNRIFDPDPNSNLLLKLKHRPSLLDLKKLRKLNIEDMLRHETYVTDVTGYLVLLQMPSLRHLNMGRSQVINYILSHLMI
ncbi:unnamed protein product [Orchesella dallaii]|uniref:F-box domain-containing protein n=1 Tax=Orchesella dallaii TaxID=48710 RepID=A0ABP1QHP4_9HEXA